MKSRFVDTEKANYPVTLICKMLKFSPKSYYAWRKREPSARQVETERLLEQIREAFERGRGTYGSPRVHAELVESGLKVGLNRVARLMRTMGLSVLPRRGFRVSTTERNPDHDVAPNVLERDFTATALNQKWVGDVTFVPTDEGWLYLATMIDLYNREIVGWAMGERNDQHLTRQCLDMALDSCASTEELLHHTDRGSTYTAGDYRDALAAQGITCSMSRKGNCWDNSVAESCFATIKKDLVHRTRFETRKSAISAIFEYVERFYNRVRRHSSLGYMTPVQFREYNTTPAQHRA